VNQQATKREMVEVQAPEMFQFTSDGSDIEGILVGISKVEVKGKTTLQYNVIDDDGKKWTFLATYDLARKLGREHIGHYIYVRYEGEDKEVKTQGSPLRRFKVCVSKENERAAAKGSGNNGDLQITDEDIPF
jgi:hypothetical protein